MLRCSLYRSWKRRSLGAAVAGLLALGGLVALPPAQAETMPEFRDTSPAAWVNSQPITSASLRGKVVLLEVYTSG